MYSRIMRFIAVAAGKHDVQYQSRVLHLTLPFANIGIVVCVRAHFSVYFVSVAAEQYCM